MNRQEAFKAKRKEVIENYRAEGWRHIQHNAELSINNGGALVAYLKFWRPTV